MSTRVCSRCDEICHGYDNCADRDGLHVCSSCLAKDPAPEIPCSCDRDDVFIPGEAKARLRGRSSCARHGDDGWCDARFLGAEALLDRFEDGVRRVTFIEANVAFGEHSIEKHEACRAELLRRLGEKQ